MIKHGRQKGFSRAQADRDDWSWAISEQKTVSQGGTRYRHSLKRQSRFLQVEPARWDNKEGCGPRIQPALLGKKRNNASFAQAAVGGCGPILAEEENGHLQHERDDLKNKRGWIVPPTFRRRPVCTSKHPSKHNCFLPPCILSHLQHQLFKRSSQHLRKRVRWHEVLVKRLRVEPPALPGTHTPCSPRPLAAAGLKSSIRPYIKKKTTEKPCVRVIMSVYFG